MFDDFFSGKICIFEENIDYVGNDLKGVLVKNQYECANNCVVEPQCLGFTYNQNNKKCWMKSKVNNRNTVHRAISGTCKHQDYGK